MIAAYERICAQGLNSRFHFLFFFIIF
jgi:hypothetical protein